MTAILERFIPGEPMPLPRARMDSRTKRTFTPTNVRAEIDRVAWELKAGMGRGGAVDVPVSVSVTFYRSTRRRVDVDNLVKLVLDAAKNVVWLDDDQVFQLHARKVLGSHRSGTFVKIEGL